MDLRNKSARTGMQVASRVTKAMIASTDHEDMVKFVEGLLIMVNVQHIGCRLYTHEYMVRSQLS